MGALRQFGVPPVVANRTKKKTGFDRYSVGITLYHLPDAAKIPRFTKDDQNMQDHMTAGYGEKHSIDLVSSFSRIKVIFLHYIS